MCDCLRELEWRSAGTAEGLQRKHVGAALRGRRLFLRPNVYQRGAATEGRPYMPKARLTQGAFDEN